MEERFEIELAERWMYIMKSVFIGKLDILEVRVDEVIFQKVHKIKEIYVTVVVDDLESTNGQAKDICHMVKKMKDKLIDFFYKHPLNPETKRITKEIGSYQLFVGEPLIMNINFSLDEEHKVEYAFHMNYESKR